MELNKISKEKVAITKAAAAETYTKNWSTVVQRLFIAWPKLGTEDLRTLTEYHS